MTKKEYFTEIKTAMSDNAEIVAFCEKEIALLDKKAAAAKNAPKKEDVLMGDVIKALTAEPKTLNEIAAEVGVSTAKVTPRLTKLVNDGRVAKTSVKVNKSKKTAYALV